MLKKFNQQEVRAEDMAPSSANYMSTTVAPLSMSSQESGIIRVLFSVLNAVFHEAGLLITSHGQQAIVAAPRANANPELSNLCNWSLTMFIQMNC